MIWSYYQISHLAQDAKGQIVIRWKKIVFEKIDCQVLLYPKHPHIPFSTICQRSQECTWYSQMPYTLREGTGHQKCQYKHRERT